MSLPHKKFLTKAEKLRRAKREIRNLLVTKNTDGHLRSYTVPEMATATNRSQAQVFESLISLQLDKLAEALDTANSGIQWATTDAGFYSSLKF
jgi:hypothetical protein